MYSIGVQADSAMARDGADHGLLHPHAHREADLEALEDRDGSIRPKARVEAHDQLSGRSGPAHPGDELFDEAHRAAWVLAPPRRRRAWSTSPVSDLVATRG